MAYASSPSLEHIDGPGICEGVCSLLVDPWERVPYPTWAESTNMTSPKKPKKLRRIASLRQTTITALSATTKIWYPMLKKYKSEKNFLTQEGSEPRLFFSAGNFAPARAGGEQKAPPGQALLVHGCGYPRTYQTPQHVSRAGQRTFPDCYYS